MFAESTNSSSCILNTGETSIFLIKLRFDIAGHILAIRDLTMPLGKESGFKFDFALSHYSGKLNQCLNNFMRFFGLCNQHKNNIRYGHYRL